MEDIRAMLNYQLRPRAPSCLLRPGFLLVRAELQGELSALAGAETAAPPALVSGTRYCAANFGAPDALRPGVLAAPRGQQRVFSAGSRSQR